MVTKEEHTISSHDEILSSLSDPFRSALLSRYNGEPQLGSGGEWHSLEPKIATSREQGMWLYNLCRQVKPKNTLEIGLAYGYSAVYFMASIRENGLGFHTAVDPFQNRLFHGIGSSEARHLGMSDRFRFIEQRSISVLVHFADRGEMFEVIYIDGNHRFDDAFMDFALSAELCPVGGYIVLDDMWLPSIRRAVAFIRSNRKDFEQIKTHLPNMAAFRRTREDERGWNHYVEFFGVYDLIRPLTPAALRRGARALVRFLRP